MAHQRYATVGLTFQIVSFLFVHWTYFCLAPFFPVLFFVRVVVAIVIRWRLAGPVPPSFQDFCRGPGHKLLVSLHHTAEQQIYLLLGFISPSLHAQARLRSGHYTTYFGCGSKDGCLNRTNEPILPGF